MHFDQDPKLKWRRCTACGCDPNRVYTSFVPHLCGSHGHSYPFHCIVGGECTFTASKKFNMMTHLFTVHEDLFPNKKWVKRTQPSRLRSRAPPKTQSRARPRAKRKEPEEENIMISESDEETEDDVAVVNVHFLEMADCQLC